MEKIFLRSEALQVPCPGRVLEIEVGTVLLACNVMYETE